MLSPADYWIWDSWIADDGDTFHLYFLQAPRSLVDPGKKGTPPPNWDMPRPPI
jgi:beta-fructofuranosidase